MSKKNLGIGVAAGLVALLFLGYYFIGGSGQVKAPGPSAPGAFQGVIPSASQPTSKGEPPALPSFPPEPAPTPPVTGPATPPAVAPLPAPAPPAAEKPVVAPPPVETKQEPALLVRKFRRYADAKRMLAKVQKQRLPAFVRKEGKYYKVWAGPFPTSREAEQARRNLQAALKISSRQGRVQVQVPK